MSLTSRLFLLLLTAGSAAFALELAGTVIEPNGKPKSGVTVALQSSGVSAITNDSGAWSLASGATGLRAHPSLNRTVSSHLRVDGNRVRMSFVGYDAGGRGWPIVSASRMFQGAFRAQEEVMDTLVYSWNGKPFLRDTISASRTGLIETFDTTWNAAIIYGHLTDSRDKKNYRSVKIGNLIWMAENLSYKTSGTNGSECLGDVDSCAKYGRYFIWPGSNTGICPGGWRVPTHLERNSMVSAVTSDSRVGYRKAGWALKSTSGWLNNGNGADLFGFRALPAGMPGSSGGRGGVAYFWNSSLKDGWDPNGTTFGSCTILSSAADTVENSLSYSSLFKFSLRCVKGP